MVIRSVVWAFTGILLLEGEWAAAEDFLLDSGVEALCLRQRGGEGTFFLPPGSWYFFNATPTGHWQTVPVLLSVEVHFPELPGEQSCLAQRLTASGWHFSFQISIVLGL